MESTRALLIDLFDFLDRVETRITNNKVDLTDFIKIIHIKHLGEIRDRIKVARETLDILEESGNVKQTDEVYGDVYLIDHSHPEEDDYTHYGKYLGISNEEFDNLVEEWAEDRGTTQRVHRKKRESKNLNFQDQIKGELAQLADALLKFTGEQEKQLDTVTHVAKESAKLTKSTSISFWQYGVMFVTLLVGPWIIMLLFMFT